MRISDWSSDVCSSDLVGVILRENGFPDEHDLTARASPLELLVQRCHELAHLRLDLRRRRGGARLCLDILADDRGQPRGNDPLLLGRDQRLCDPHPPYQDTNDQKDRDDLNGRERSEEHTYELQSLMRISYTVF